MTGEQQSAASEAAVPSPTPRNSPRHCGGARALTRPGDTSPPCYQTACWRHGLVRPGRRPQHQQPAAGSNRCRPMGDLSAHRRRKRGTHRELAAACARGCWDVHVRVGGRRSLESVRPRPGGTWEGSLCWWVSPLSGRRWTRKSLHLIVLSVCCVGHQCRLSPIMFISLAAGFAGSFMSQKS